MTTGSGELHRITDFAALVDLVGARDGLYLRYSHGPEADANTQSRDYESGLDLPGLSCTVLDPEPWWTRPLEDWLARQVRKYADLGEAEEDRYAWILTGRVTARGPDHEPLLADVEPVARLDDAVVSRARDLYRERFDPGRDSTSG
ncbi:DUF6098 family protein [Streptomonospora sp. S1-112]|uniref:DUF6098 family protein n=1 Tax=Streptomonospora mangrovi TaxID=2883123 RepID=A0A9X3NKP3_9ACTN|nr:DUF6098 family protein [Streptomonospora mangrovi]MDA0564775.1 DUF6098 family protein [Streptomonospora mangrovi]